MMILALLLLLGNGHKPPQRVDVIEYNTVYDECTCDLRYEQYIFRKWNPEYRRHDIVGWMMPRGANTKHVKIGDRHIIKWNSGKDEFAMESPIYKETHYQYDPERLEKVLLNENLRTGIRPLR